MLLSGITGTSRGVLGAFTGVFGTVLVMLAVDEKGDHLSDPTSITTPVFDHCLGLFPVWFRVETCLQSEEV